jgi:hypothetical protein
MTVCKTGVLVFMTIGCLRLPAQDSLKVVHAEGKSISVASVHTAEQKIHSLETRLSRNTEKYLRRLQKTENRIYRKLARKNSLAARNYLAESRVKYEKALQQLTSKPEAAANTLKEYIPGLDSLNTAFRFLEKSVPGINPDALKKIGDVSGQLSTLQSSFQSAVNIEQFIRQRQELLREQLNKLGMVESLQKFSKEAYYYRQQLNEYKEMLKDPDKIATKAMAIARNSAGFRDFFAKNSQLAQLFPMPGTNSGSGVSLQGLQTRASVQQQLSGTLGVGGGGMVDPQQFMQQQVQQAQTQLNALKDKINKMGGGSSELEMPDFKPNSQRTQTFLERIEYGLNIQSQRPNGLLPVTSDLALTAGYKLNDKSVIGIGASYKMGWGRNISNINITSQGMSLRSFMDMKIKGSIWISGGFEYNYQQEFARLDQLYDIDAWQRSGLIGISKKYKIGKKKGNMQLLWDFLSYSQVPRTTPLKFRIGYVF